MTDETIKGSGTPFATAVASIVALFFLAISAWLVYYQTDWNRVVVVYNAVCSVAFSAFGVLLGSKVQEGNVTRAQQNANAAHEAARQQQQTIQSAAQALQNRFPDDEAGGGTVPAVQANRVALGILMTAIK